MSKRSDLEIWIAAANAVTVDVGAGDVAAPLISNVSGDPAGVYTTNAPLIAIPNLGELYGEGEQFKFLGVTTAAAVQNTGWNTFTNEQLILAIRQVAEMDLGQASISMIPEPMMMGAKIAMEPEAKVAVEPEAKVAVEPEPLMAVPDAVEPEAEAVETPDFDAMTKKQIDAWAVEQGIDVDGRLSKTDMIEFVTTELAK